MKSLSMGLALFLAVIAAIAAVAVLSYKTAYPTYTYRYKMTVNVNVAGHIRSGSSVIEVRLKTQPQLLPGIGPVLAEAFGEAIFVDLGEDRHVIAVLASERGIGEDFANHVVPAHFHLSYESKDLVKYPELEGRWELDQRTLPSWRIPTSVIFADLNEPKTARVVSPDEFSQVFGPDVSGPLMTIEMTKEPVTRSIQTKLPWLPHPNYLSGRFGCAPTEPHCLHGGHFKRS